MLRTTFLQMALLRLSAYVVCILAATRVGLGEQGNTPPARANSENVEQVKLPDDVEQVLWWLPEETETMVVARGKVFIQNSWPTMVPREGQNAEAGRIPTIQRGRSNSDSSFAASHDSKEPVAEWRYQDLILDPTLYAGDDPCGNLREKMLRTFFDAKGESLFVSAVWWEKDTTRQMCNMVVFSDDAAVRLVQAQAAYPHTSINVQGVRAIKVDLNHGRYDNPQPMPIDLSDLDQPLRPNWRYLAAVRPNVYVAATSSELLQVIVHRMDRRGQKRALPPELPEWNYIDSMSPAWGLRHYRGATAQKDSLSMLKWDPNAKGLVLLGGNKPWRFLAVRYISDSPDLRDRFLRMQTDTSQFKIPAERFTQIDRNCIEHRTRLYLSEKEQAKIKEIPADGPVDDSISCGCRGFFYFPWLGLMSPPLVAAKSK